MANNRKDIFSKITQNFTFNRRKEIKPTQNTTAQTNTQSINHNQKNPNMLHKEAYYSSEEVKEVQKSEDKIKESEKKEDIAFSFEGFKALQNVITSRRSVRSYTSEKPQKKLIHEIIKTAYNAPRAGNITNYHTLIVTESSKIAQIANLSYQQSWIAQAPMLFVIVSKSDEISRFYPDYSQKYSTQNTSVFVQNLLLLIHAAGLATCWVESFQEEILKDYLSISSLDQIHAILPIGYAKETPKTPEFGELMMYLSYNSFGNRENR